MHRIGLIAILCGLILIFSSACTGAHEIDDWAYVYTIGIDRGVTDQLRFTFQMPSYKGGSGGGSEGPQSEGMGQYNVVSVDSPNFYSGINMLNASLSRTLNFMHSKYMVISEELAKEGLERFVHGMIRSNQIRRNMNIVIVKGAAVDFVKEFNPAIGTSVSKTQDLLMEHQGETGLFDEVNYNNFAIGIKNTYTQATAALAAINDFSGFKAGGMPPKEFKSMGDYYAGELPRSGGNKYEFVGTAVFNGDKMVGELNGDETRAMLMLRGEFDSASMVIPDPLDAKLRIGYYVKQRKKPDIAISFRNGEPVIHAKVYIDGELQNVQSGTEYENEELKPVAENAFSAFVREQIDKTVGKCRDLNCEVFNFGAKAVAQFRNIQEWEKYNWIAHFKNAEVTTEVSFIMRRTGTLMKTSETMHTGGRKQ